MARTLESTNIDVRLDDKAYMNVLVADKVNRTYNTTKEGWEVSDGRFLKPIKDGGK